MPAHCHCRAIMRDVIGCRYRHVRDRNLPRPDHLIACHHPCYGTVANGNQEGFGSHFVGKRNTRCTASLITMWLRMISGLWKAYDGHRAAFFGGLPSNTFIGKLTGLLSNSESPTNN